MFNVILYQPEIPPNTGNIIRLCANTGSKLHLIDPLGFELDDRRLRRAGLDYHEMARVTRYPDWPAFTESHPDMRLWGLSSRGKVRYDQASFQPGDGLLFGPETRGLPDGLGPMQSTTHWLRLPMQVNNRSLNLSNTVAVVLYEALRQADFNGLA